MRDQDSNREETRQEIRKPRTGTFQLKEDVSYVRQPARGGSKSRILRKRSNRGTGSTSRNPGGPTGNPKYGEADALSLLNACPDPMVVYDIRGVPSFVNSAFSRLFGWTSEELRSGNTDFVPPPDMLQSQEIVGNVLRGEALSNIETRRTTRNGDVIDVAVTGEALMDHRKHAVGAVVLIRDISSEKQGHHAAQESADNYRTIIESIEDGYYEVDLRGNFVIVNDAVAELFGCSKHRLTGMNYRSFMDGDTVSRVVTTFKEVFRTGKSGRLFDYEIIRLDGTKRSMSVSVALARDASAFARGFRGICRDITERKQAESGLARELTKFEALYDLALAMTQEGNLKQHLSLIVGKSRQLLKSDTAYIALTDFESQELFLHTLAGTRSERFKRIRVPLGTGVGGRVAATGRGLVIKDYFKEAEPILHDLVREEGLISGVAAPIQIEQTVLGVLYAFNRTETAFSKSDLDTLCLLANLAAVEITRSYAEQELQRSYDDLEYRVRARTAELHETNQRLLLEIADRRRAEDNLRKSEERYRVLYEESKRREELYLSLLNSSADAVVIYDMAGRARYVNPCFTHTFGWTLEEIEGKEIDFVPIAEREATLAIVEGLIRDGTPCSAFESKRYTKDGRIVDVSISASTYRDHEGKPAGILSILRDVSRRKRSEQRLERALATAIQLRLEAEAANRAKSEFLANMSHELRTPLNAIIGFSEILEDQAFGPLNERQAHYMSHVLNSGRHLLRLISDILDLAKVEAGKLDITRSTVHVAQLLRDSLALFKDEARAQDLTLTLHVGQDIRNTTIQADEMKLKQILFNLISNAIKFTPAGGDITLNVTGDEHELRISVCDTGIGLNPNDYDRIFSAFEQVDSTYSRFQTGTGLGLALTRRLVQLHAGRIWVESPGVNQGSTFTLAVPRIPEPPAPP